MATLFKVKSHFIGMVPTYRNITKSDFDKAKRGEPETLFQRVWQAIEHFFWGDAKEQAMQCLRDLFKLADPSKNTSDSDLTDLEQAQQLFTQLRELASLDCQGRLIVRDDPSSSYLILQLGTQVIQISKAAAQLSHDLLALRAWAGDFQPNCFLDGFFPFSPLLQFPRHQGLP